MSADAGSAAEDGSVFRPPLQTEHFFLEPLTPKDFNALHAVASDPLLWEQHPEADRWKRSKFQHFFQDVVGRWTPFQCVSYVFADVKVISVNAIFVQFVP